MIFRLYKAILRMLWISLLATSVGYAADNNDYLLGAGDTIKIVVFRNPDLTTETRVTEGGKITFPLIGEVAVSGKSIHESEQEIAKALSDGGFVQQAQVNIILEQIVGNRVAVIGMVSRPGRFPLDVSNIHLSEMLATAGGVLPNQGNGIAMLSGKRKDGELKLEIDLASVFINHEKDKDVELANGDVIYVIPGNQVSVLGMVNRPGRYPLDKMKMRLTDVISMAGGISQLGSDIAVVTGIRNGQPFKSEVDLADIYLTDKKDGDVFVQADDQVYVHRYPTFYIYGEAQRPGNYRVERNMTIIQALSVGGGLTGRGTQRNIKVYRRNASGEIEKLSPELTEYVKPDDVIYVQESLF